MAIAPMAFEVVASDERVRAIARAMQEKTEPNIIQHRESQCFVSAALPIRCCPHKVERAEADSSREPPHDRIVAPNNFQP